MYTRLSPSLTRLALPVTRPLLSHPYRLIHLTPTLLSGSHPLSPTPTETPTKPATTQGHATDKPGRDIQSDYVKQGQAQRKDAAGTGEDQPLDAARLDGGEAKKAEGTGAFKDQVGGQDVGGSAGKMGGKEEAAGEGTGDKVKKALRVKSSRNFSTSALSSFSHSLPPLASAPDLSGARKPADPSVQGDQNPHLKHRSSGEGDSGKGNAASEPHLPSREAQKDDGPEAKTKSSLTNAAIPKSPQGQGRAGYHTTARRGAEGAKYAGSHLPEAGKTSGYNTPPEALPPKLTSAYNPSEATPPAPSGSTPSSESQYSSTAEDPAHPVLKEKVLKGEMPKKNPQPHGGLGKKGIDEAWKDIKP